MKTIPTLGTIGSLLFAAGSNAAVIIEDTFTRKGQLHGSVADSGQTWDMWVGQNPNVASDGSTLFMEGANSSRIDGLTFVPNCTYNLSMEVGLISATPQWTGFGFGNQHIDSVGFMLFKYSPEVQFFTEDINLGQQTIPLPDRSVRLFDIELQTGSTLADSTLSWSIDGSPVGVPASVDASGIDSVFLQASGSESVVDNFRLTHSVPEPSSLLLIALGGVGLISRRKRS